MAIWYKVEKTKQGIKDFLDCNWGFHDFRIERVEYVAGNDMVEIFLRYDTRKEGVRLRFVGLSGVHIYVDLDYEADWLYDTTLLLRDDGDLQWFAAEDVNEVEAENPTFCTWVKSNEMIWAITDGEGQPVEMPADRLNQVWHDYGKTTQKHFQFQEVQANTSKEKEL